jgi:F-type H+-transporting ATPase subunit epsilon
MPDLLELQVATPERELVREQVNEVQVPGKEGYLGILPGHAAIASLLGTGALSFLIGGRRHFVALQGGFLEVLADRVRVLADRAERAEEIDLERARTDLARANQQLANVASTPDADPQALLDAAALAQARVTAGEQK